MRVRIIFLRINYGDRRDAHHFLDGGRALQHVDGTAHSHQNRSDEFSTPDFRGKLAGDIGRGQIGEDQHVRATLERAEGIKLFNNFRGQRLVRHNLAIDDQGWVGVLDQFHCLADLRADRVVDATEAGKREECNPRCQVETPRHMSGTEGDLDKIFRRRFNVDASVGQEKDLAFARYDGIAARHAMQALAHAYDL